MNAHPEYKFDQFQILRRTAQFVKKFIVIRNQKSLNYIETDTIKCKEDTLESFRQKSEQSDRII